MVSQQESGEGTEPLPDREASNRCLWPVMGLLQAAVILKTVIETRMEGSTGGEKRGGGAGRGTKSDHTSAVCKKKSSVTSLRH